MPPLQARLGGGEPSSSPRSQSVALLGEDTTASASLPSSQLAFASASSSSSSSSSTLLPFARSIIRSIIPADDEPLDEGDALIILAKGLGLRSIVAHVLKIYDAPTNLVLVVNAKPEEEAGLSEELTTLGVRKPGLRSVGHETVSKAR